MLQEFNYKSLKYKGSLVMGAFVFAAMLIEPFVNFIYGFGTLRRTQNMRKFLCLALAMVVAASFAFAEENEKVVASIVTVDGNAIVVKASVDQYVDVKFIEGTLMRLSDQNVMDIIRVIERFDLVVAEVQSNPVTVGCEFGGSPIIPSLPYDTKIRLTASCHGSVDKTFLGITILLNPSDGGGYGHASKTVYLTQAQAHELSSALSGALDTKRQFRTNVSKILSIVRGQ